MFKQIKNGFGAVWLVWSGIIFLISWPFVFIAYMLVYRVLAQNKKYERGFWVSKIWGHFVNFFIGLRLKIYGRDAIDQNGVYVYVCNHRSQTDIPINFAINKQPFVILSKKEATKIPVVGTNLKYAHVTVDRKDSQSRKKAMDALAQHLKTGRSVLLYPEGRRNRSSEVIEEFKKGAFLLAIQNQVPIVPITIIGSDKINNPTKPFALYPGKVSVYYDEPISTENMTLNNLDELIKVTRDKMIAHFE